MFASPFGLLILSPSCLKVLFLVSMCRIGLKLRGYWALFQAAGILAPSGSNFHAQQSGAGRPNTEEEVMQCPL